MKNIFRTILFFLVSISISCSIRTNDQPDDVTFIDVESNIENFRPLKLSEVASYIEYIPLESPSGFLFKWISDIAIYDNYILAQGLEKAGLFHRDGTFITEIGKQGKGPGQYTMAGVSYILDELIYLPNVIGQNYIYVYDLTGKFIRACQYPLEHISSVHSNWLPISSNEFLLQVPNTSGDQDFRIIKVDCKGNILKSFPNSTKFQPYDINVFSTDSQAGQFYIFDNKIRYKEVRNDTVWELSGENLRVKYILHRGKLGSDVDFRTLPAKRHGDDKIRISRIFETRKFLLFETGFKALYPFNFYMEYNPITGRNRSFGILGIYNKETGDTYFVKPSNLEDTEFPPGIPTGIQNDIDGGVNFFPKQYISDSILVSWIEAHKLIDYAASEVFKSNKPKNMERKQEFAALANSLTINDNPVLIVVKLKQ